MINPFNQLLHALMQSTEQDLRRQIQFFKAENEILRSRLPKSIVCTPRERARLLKLGRPLGRASWSLITIVQPRTFLRWKNQADGTPSVRRRRRGRPRTPEEIRQLVLRIASETSWGYTHVLGELRTLGIHKISQTTVYNILRDHGYDLTLRVCSRPGTND